MGCIKCASLADCAGLVGKDGKQLVPTNEEAIVYRNSSKSEAKKAFKDHGCEGYKLCSVDATCKEPFHSECEDLDKSVVKTEAAYNSAVAANEPEDPEESSAITATASFVVVAAVAML